VVAITFDDGYRSVLEYGFPVLSELGLTASIYVPTKWVGSDQPMRWPGIDSWSDGPQSGELLCLDWDQLRELQEAGWEVGSHTVSHPFLPHLSDADLRTELSESRQTIERELGKPCHTLAYPYGAHDHRVEAATKAAGYEAASILAAGPVGRYHWPRIGVYSSDGRARFAIKTGRATLMVAFSSLGGYVDRLRR
jgi:peptidoglycan/xylan/chitin deacetylase (PgdA/CDA1 family)